MANIQVIPLDIQDVDPGDVVLANAAIKVFPQESMWEYSNGDLIVGGSVPARSGSWVSRFNIVNLESPPYIRWAYSADAENNATVIVENRANQAYLKVNNIDLKPDPKTLYPDRYWEVNGLDLIPRGE